MSRPYREPNPAALGLFGLTAIIVVGFLVDVAVSGGVDHLLAWGIALAVVVVLNLVVGYGARAQKTLELNDDQLRVGEEMVLRTDISAVAPHLDTEGLRVLGWPNGAPARLSGLAVRLRDGYYVLVPTRFPRRLQKALEPKTTNPPH